MLPSELLLKRNMGLILASLLWSTARTSNRLVKIADTPQGAGLFELLLKDI